MSNSLSSKAEATHFPVDSFVFVHSLLQLPTPIPETANVCGLLGALSRSANGMKTYDRFAEVANLRSMSINAVEAQESVRSRR
jgi:hypothetical protein